MVDMAAHISNLLPFALSGRPVILTTAGTEIPRRWAVHHHMIAVRAPFCIFPDLLKPDAFPQLRLTPLEDV